MAKVTKKQILALSEDERKILRFIAQRSAERRKRSKKRIGAKNRLKRQKIGQK